MSSLVAILEDNPERIVLMREVVAAILPDCQTHFVVNAPEMIAWLRENLAQVCFISLDHDLDSVVPRELQAFDPGCGRDVADYLAQHPPISPIIVHTTNEGEAVGMIRVLRESGWMTLRTRPRDGMNWIKTDWADDLKSLLRRGLIFQ